MTTPDRCPVCDAVLSTGAGDCASMHFAAVNHPSGSRAPVLAGPSVDWRDRALTAEADLDASLARELRQAEQLDQIFAAFLEPRPRTVVDVVDRIAVWQLPDAWSRIADYTRGDQIGGASCEEDPE